MSTRISASTFPSTRYQQPFVLPGTDACTGLALVLTAGLVVRQTLVVNETAYNLPMWNMPDTFEKVGACS